MITLLIFFTDLIRLNERSKFSHQHHARSKILQHVRGSAREPCASGGSACVDCQVFQPGNPIASEPSGGRILNTNQLLNLTGLKTTTSNFVLP